MWPEDCAFLVGRHIGVGWLHPLSTDSSDEFGEQVVKISRHGFVVLAVPITNLGIAEGPMAAVDQLAVVAVERCNMGPMKQGRQQAEAVSLEARTGKLNQSVAFEAPP